MEETLIACQTFSLKQTGDFTTDESATVRSRESFVCMSQAWDEPRIISNIAADPSYERATLVSTARWSKHMKIEKQGITRAISW